MLWELRPHLPRGHHDDDDVDDEDMDDDDDDDDDGDELGPHLPDIHHKVLAVAVGHVKADKGDLWDSSQDRLQPLEVTGT